MSKKKNKNYYGSPLNKFVDEKCDHKMTCINIDCLMLKRSQKKIRIIESKHSNEKLPPSQLEALSRLHDLLSKGMKESDWDASVFIVRGDPPYKNVKVNIVQPQNTNGCYTLSQGDFIKWLEFKEDLQNLSNQLEEPTVNLTLAKFMGGKSNGTIKVKEARP